MLQSFRTRRNRKGFTLAELLIVVAIIAVLVAIAVPLFVGSLSKARKATEDANVRAVRGTAVVYLLENVDDAAVWYEGGTEAADKSAEFWVVNATVSSSGEIAPKSVEPKHADPKQELVVEVEDGEYTITLQIEKTEVTIKA